MKNEPGLRWENLVIFHLSFLHLIYYKTQTSRYQSVGKTIWAESWKGNYLLIHLQHKLLKIVQYALKKNEEILNWQLKTSRCLLKS